MNVTGRSSWTSPIGEVGLEARDGVYRFTGSSPFSGIAAGVASLPLPPGTSPETREAIRTMGRLASAMERLLGGGLPEVDLDTPWTWERTWRGVLRDGSALIRSVFPTLTGAVAYETVRIGSGPIVDILRDGSPITGRTVDVLVGERLDLEGPVRIWIRYQPTGGG